MTAPPPSRPLGSLIDELGVGHEPAEGELVLGAVVLLKVLEPDGQVSMRSTWSPGLTWMERVGMHQAAAQTDIPMRPSGRWDTAELDGVDARDDS
ncbi:hypothetical protein [Nocardioides acrostichi]|uniref:Uncharacterized protein n=1 Tax=Nocardioides acrostichi TaxID=2784339 RepID=A0A930UX99_9ACTN|nr:hypothetical protein [Nocardioides acrostichi]MBF4161382.1 hypothetical protein [Nocardioides acrostichi]